MSRWQITTLTLVLCALAGCSKTRTGRDDCTRILDHLIEAQFKTMNLADPELLRRRKMEFQDLFKDDLARCEGMELSASAKACIEAPEFSGMDIQRCFGKN